MAELDVREFRGAIEISGEGYFSVIPLAFDVVLAEEFKDDMFVEMVGRELSNLLCERYKAIAEGRFEDVQRES